jgi:hypothetical protein
MEPVEPRMQRCFNARDSLKMQKLEVLLGQLSVP